MALEWEMDKGSIPYCLRGAIESIEKSCQQCPCTKAIESIRHSNGVYRMRCMMMSLLLHWHPNIAPYVHPLHSRCRSESF